MTAAPERGFGSWLIEDSVTYQLKGTVELRFETQGVECRFLLPLSSKIEARHG